jgi:uncharacterized membrane protein
LSTGRFLLASVFVGAGVLHFCFTSAYVNIIPPYLPEPRLLVFMSGVAEVLGGVGLLVTETRGVAAWGLVALLVALMPANVQMALDHERWRSIPEWALGRGCPSNCR